MTLVPPPPVLFWFDSFSHYFPPFLIFDQIRRIRGFAFPMNLYFLPFPMSGRFPVFSLSIFKSVCKVLPFARTPPQRPTRPFYFLLIFFGHPHNFDFVSTHLINLLPPPPPSIASHSYESHSSCTSFIFSMSFSPLERNANVVPFSHLYLD